MRRYKGEQVSPIDLDVFASLEGGRQLVVRFCGLSANASRICKYTRALTTRALTYQGMHGRV